MGTPGKKCPEEWGVSKITCIFTDLKIINLYFHIMKRHITFALLFAAALTAQAQQGGISGEMLNQIKQSYKATPADKAIRNALGGTSINTLALNQENRADFDTEFHTRCYPRE